MALRNNIKLLLLLLVFSAGIRAQNSAVDIPAVSEGDIQFYTDHSAFKGNEGKLVAEFYFMLFADQLVINEKDGKNIAEFSVNATLFNSSGVEIKTNNWTTEAAVNIPVTTADVIYDQWSTELDPGVYKLNVVIADKNSRKKGKAELNINIAPVREDEFASSMVEFVSKVEESKPSDHFKKGSKSVVPNPSRRYGVLNPVLYFYYELYNLTAQSSLRINYSVINKSADTVKTFPAFNLEASGKSASVLHGLNVANIASGIYSLDIYVEDIAAKRKLNFSRRFEVIQKDYAELKPELSVKEDEVFEWLLGIFGTEYQQKLYSQLNINAKAEFMVQFWKNQDQSSGTPENEFLEKVQQRFRYANEKFKWGENEGWKSERGRVLVQYGMPDQVERHYAEAGTVPYEIWEYSEARSFYFVFADLRSDGRFALVHSNKEGEVSNERWIKYIRRL